MNLKKIVIFTRHGVRNPLANATLINDFISENLVNFKTSDYSLTDKGKLIEYQLGLYIKRIFDELGYKPSKKYVYANSLHRTYLTGRILSLALFPYENIKVNIKDESLDYMDPHFNIIIEDKNILNQKVVDDTILTLKDRFNKLENILNIKENSLYNYKTNICINELGHVMVDGGLYIANSIIDLFTTYYYNGLEYNEIFKSDNFIEDLKYISLIKDVFLETVFGNNDYTNNSKLNCYKLLQEALIDDNDFNLLVGHDASLCTILKMLNLDISMNNKIEKYPIAGKLIFYVYDNNEVKIDLIYPYYKSIREDVLDIRKEFIGSFKLK